MSLHEGFNPVRLWVQDSFGQYKLLKRPLISGAGAVGARLTASTGAFSGNLTGIQIRWQRCSRRSAACRTVSHGSAYLVVRADRGKRLRVLARATGEDGIPVDAFSRFLPVRC